MLRARPVQEWPDASFVPYEEDFDVKLLRCKERSCDDLLGRVVASHGVYGNARLKLHRGPSLGGVTGILAAVTFSHLPHRPGA